MNMLSSEKFSNKKTINCIILLLIYKQITLILYRHISPILITFIIKFSHSHSLSHIYSLVSVPLLFSSNKKFSHLIH